MDCPGGEAAGNLDNLFLAGGDIDVYFCEADWALKFINDDTRAAALEEVGFSEDNFTDTFAYTNEIGRATKGKYAGKMVGASWQSCPGGFAYNAELAKQYLDVDTPEQMQEKVGDWDKFVAAATEVATKSNKSVALADSLGGMWQVFAANRKSAWVDDGILEIDESCKTFADYAKTLWDNGGVTHNSQWDNSWVPAGASGACMGYFASTWGLGGFVKDASANSQGKWKLIQGPDPYFWGGTWMVVNPKTDNAKEAQELIYTAVVNPESMKDYSKSKPEYVNSVSVMNDVVSSGDVNEEVKANFGGENYFEPLHANAQKIDLKGLITPYDASIKAAFLDVVTKNYCTNGEDWEACKDAFNKKVNKDNPTLD
ncbi:MAG: carbohydrate ABC transporter substrate-binding protein [Ruminococcus sp.]|nr:carbohydrate ABC transporter substrate-binding protein [Ruminococcus sp.]